MNYLLKAVIIILFSTANISFRPAQDTRTVYVYAMVHSADFKKTVFSYIYQITVMKRDPYLESGEINLALKMMESNFKKYMYVHQNWDKYVSEAGFYDDTRSKLEEKRLEKMASEKRAGNTVSVHSGFYFSYSAGDAYK